MVLKNYKSGIWLFYSTFSESRVNKNIFWYKNFTLGRMAEVYFKAKLLKLKKSWQKYSVNQD